jgi:hypothetical protein
MNEQPEMRPNGAESPRGGSADRRWSWTQARETAASLVADDILSDIEIASKAGVGKATLERWKKVPLFYARVLDIREALRKTAAAGALQHGVANCRERMMCLNEQWNRLQRVVSERAKAPDMQNIPGGRTGLLVRRVRSIGGDETVDEYAVDTGLLHEIREYAKQAAQEMGQWVEHHKEDSDYNGELADWTEEELDAFLELHRQHRERVAQPRALGPAGEASPPALQDLPYVPDEGRVRREGLSKAPGTAPVPTK